MTSQYSFYNIKVMYVNMGSLPRTIGWCIFGIQEIAQQKESP